MNKFIEIDGKYYSECSAVLHNTKDSTQLRFTYGYDSDPLTYDLALDEKELHNCKNSTKQYLHMHILSKDSICIGDLFYVSSRNEIHECQMICDDGLIMGYEEEIAMFQDNTYYVYNPDDCKKIIATTNKKLIDKHKISNIPSDFMFYYHSKYNDCTSREPLSNFLVEYSKNEEPTDDGDSEKYATYSLKIDALNNINILKYKELSSIEDIVSFGLECLELGMDLQNNPLARLNNITGKEYYCNWLFNKYGIDRR